MATNLVQAVALKYKPDLLTVEDFPLPGVCVCVRCVCGCYVSCALAYTIAY